MNKLLRFKNSKCLFKNVAVSRCFSSNSDNVVRSKLPNISIPNNLFLEEYVWRGLDKWHDKTAMVCSETGRGYMYSDLYKNSKALRNVLAKFHNLNQGDTLAIVLPNVPEYPIIMMGAIEAGLLVTTVNPVYTADEICKQLMDCDAKIIFTLTNFWPKVSQAAKKLNSNIPIIALKIRNNEEIPEGAIQYEQLIEKGRNLDFDKGIVRKSEDVILLPYSSGTTGMPKGVELTHKSLVSNLYQFNAPGIKMFNDAEGIHQEVCPLVLPMFHLYGLVVVMVNMLSSGCKLVTTPKFTSASFIKILEDFNPTFAYLAPPLVLFLLNNEKVRSEYLERIKTIMSAAAPLGALDVERIREKSKNQTNILQAYGLTETSPITHSQTTHIENGIKSGGCGIIVPNTECKVVSVKDSKTTLGPNKSGELFIRGPQIMKGYRKNPKATQEAIDADGWFRTGDIGFYDENEHFYITDRLKELIKVKGFQVAPAELEELLRSHPKVADAAVIGVPHSKFGEVPKAFVVVKENCRINLLNVKKFIDNKVANYKHLAGGVVKVDSIPKTTSGKILRRELKNL